MSDTPKSPHERQAIDVPIEQTSRYSVEKRPSSKEQDTPNKDTIQHEAPVGVRSFDELPPSSQDNAGMHDVRDLDAFAKKQEIQQQEEAGLMTKVRKWIESLGK